MSDCCQFDLQSRFHARCMFIEDFQYKIYPIPDIDTERAEFLLDIENLSRFEDVSNDQGICAQSLHFEDDFL